MSDTAQPLLTAVLVVTHTVADFDAWKAVFDEHESARREAGIVGHHLNRNPDDLDMVGVSLGLSDVQKAKKFAPSEELQQTMQDAGVTGPPDMMWIRPLRESIVWDRKLPAFLISHHVADVDAWLDGYDAADELQRSGGIVGHAAYVSLDDPSLVSVYHQAESVDDLRAFLDNPELKTVMAAAGVTSEPDVTFMTGGWAKFYD